MASSCSSLRVLSIRQPWPCAILHLGKDVENRSWDTDYRGWIGVHASSLPDAGARERLTAMGLELPALLPTGALVGVVRLVDCVRDHPSRWAIPGQYHWLLADALALPEPVPWKGALWLWFAPDDLTESVFKQVPEIRTLG